jgi:hypothetical protein
VTATNGEAEFFLPASTTDQKHCQAPTANRTTPPKQASFLQCHACLKDPTPFQTSEKFKQNPEPVDFQEATH